MKNITRFITACSLLACLSNAFAAVSVAAVPPVPFNGSDYVGKIDAASYQTTMNDGQKEILVMTSKDDKNQDNQLSGLTLKINADDLPFGLTLASAIGKKVAVSFSNGNYDIASVTIITDKYYYGPQDSK